MKWRREHGGVRGWVSDGVEEDGVRGEEGGEEDAEEEEDADRFERKMLAEEKGKWRQDVDVGVEKLKRIGSALGDVAKMTSKWSMGMKGREIQGDVERRGRGGKKTCQPVSNGQDPSGWYSDSDDDE